MAKFDLHLHTSNSDGSDTAKELVSKIIEEGIDIFSVTDHDTTEGALETSKIVPKDKKFILGVELTCKTDDVKCHILGYGYNPNDDGLYKLIDKGKILRRQKLETRIEYLKKVWNIYLTQEELDWLYSRNSVVKTHFANILVSRGLAEDNVSAMAKYLDGCKTGNTRFDGREAISTLKNAGAIVVWAHPLGGEGEKHDTKEEFLPKLETMTDAGIQGLECYYSRYNMEEISFLIECANKYNLYITGGSDWHGTNKTVPLGRLNCKNIFIDSSKINLPIISNPLAE
ncbi:PHP domain-containing protein [bacterium]|nr:PHP domain-containing protein [bacterium]